jgi:hypothetical protein
MRRRIEEELLCAAHPIPKYVRQKGKPSEVMCMLHMHSADEEVWLKRRLDRSANQARIQKPASIRKTKGRAGQDRQQSAVGARKIV